MPISQNRIKYGGKTQKFDFFNKMWEIKNDLFSKEERKRRKQVKEKRK